MPSEASAAGSPSKKTDQGWIDIKKFSLQVIEAGKVKPLPNYVLQGPKGGALARGGRAGAGAGNPLGAFEAEKKYKKNLEALKYEIEDKNREIDGLRKEKDLSHDSYKRLDAEKKSLEVRLVDKHSKPPRETQNESIAHSQAQQLA